MKLFRTDDINLAAYLQEIGFKLINTERKERKVTFIFDDEKGDAERSILLYLNGAQVEAVGFANRQRHLKTLVMRGVNG